MATMGTADAINPRPNELSWRYARAMFVSGSILCLVCILLIGSRDVARYVLFGHPTFLATDFTSGHVYQLEHLFGIALPPGAIVDLATVSGHRDHELTVRIHIPAARASEFRQALQKIVVKPDMAF